MSKAICLLSGGLDSATALAIAMREHADVYALTFDYGQRHVVETDAAWCVARAAGVLAHSVMDIDLRMFGGSALTSGIQVPKDRALDEMAGGVPVTYVPARNTIFLSYALAYAEMVGAAAIYLGVNALDYSGYPDCRPEFITAFQVMANLATKMGIEGRGPHIIAPLIGMTKAQIIAEGTRLGVNYSLTSSCYDPSPLGEACGRCDSCQLRLKGFADAGLTDPIKYQ